MASLFPFVFNPTLVNPGAIAPNAKMAFYLTGTSTLTPVYDAAGNPISQAANGAGVSGVTADSFGRFPNIYLDDAVTYRVALRTAQGATITPDIDPYKTASAGNLPFSHSTNYGSGTFGAALNQYVSVKDAPYNAKGDGTTNDTAAIQAALDSGKPLYFPSGTYVTTATLNCSGPRKIVGDGQGMSVIQGQHTGSVLSWSNVWTNGSSIRDISIDGHSTAVGIFVGSDTETTAHMLWENVQIINCTTGTWGGTKAFTLFDSVLIKVDFYNCSIIGEVLSGSGNRHEGCTYRLCHYGIEVDQQAGGYSIGGGSFIGGTWVGNTFDVVFNANPCRQLLFDGCWFEQTVTSVFGNLLTSIYHHTFTVKGALFQPAATATGNGVWTPPATLLGSVEFDSCVVFADAYTSATLPVAATTSLLPQLSMRVTNSRRLLSGGTVEEIPSWDNTSLMSFPKIMQFRLYANDAAAGAAGLTFGDLYYNSTVNALSLKN